MKYSLRFFTKRITNSIKYDNTTPSPHPFSFLSSSLFGIANFKRFPIMILGVSSVFFFPAMIPKAVSQTDELLFKLIDTEQLTQENQENQDIQPDEIIPDSVQRESEPNQSNSNPFKIIQGSPRRGIKDIIELLSGSFSTFYSLLKRAKDGLLELLTENDLVIFAPTEEALASSLNQLRQPENREQLKQLLRNHIIVGGISDAQFEQGSVQTLGGETLQLQRTADGFEVNGVKVYSDKFIQSTEQNSVIIPVDQFLFEPNLR